MKLRALLVGAALGLSVAPPSWSAISMQIAPSSDGTLWSNYQNGDKPPAGCTAPSGWTVASKGNGDGEICDDSGTWTFAVLGTSASNGFRYAYKDVASGDFQLSARINNDYEPSGALANFAGIGITISDGTADADDIHNVFVPFNGTSITRALAGTPGSTTAANGTPGGTRPWYVCAGYDESAGQSRVLGSSDGTNWLEVQRFDKTFSSPLVGLYGQSGSSSATITATVDNIELRTGASAINCWTPETPPDPSAPELVSEITNQSATQGIAFSLSCAANWTGATSYTMPANGAAGGFPTGTGLSFNGSTCAITGTPNANDVGSRNLTITAHNASGDTPDTFLLTTFTTPGDVFTIATQAGTTQRTYNGAVTSGANGATWASIRTSGSGTRPGPGDIIQFAAGTHRGKITFSNLTGSDTARIRIANQTSGGSAALLEKTTGQGGGFWFTCDNCENVDIDGTGGWSGSSGFCGSDDDLAVDDECGIQIKTDASDPHATKWIRIIGSSTKYSIKGVLIDTRTGTGGDAGIGISANDKAVLNTCGGGTNCDWREDITISHNVLKGIATEAMYIGQNGGDDALPLRRVEIDHNWVDGAGRECINGKYWRDGPNSVHHNVVENCSTDNAAGQIRGINITDGGDVDIYANKVIDTNGVGISHIINSANAADPGDSTYYSNIYNNIIIRPTGDGIFIEDNNAAQDQITPVVAEYNTIITAGGNGVEKGDSDGSCVARNNIIAPAKAVTNCTSTNNRTGSVASQGFVSSGSDDYHLTSGSAARNGATGSCPNVDIDGDARPQQGTCDQGADEFVP